MQYIQKGTGDEEVELAWTALRLNEDRIETVIGGGDCKVTESALLGFEIRSHFSDVLTKGRSH